MSRARDLFSRIIAGGYDGVLQMICDQVTEELFLDYKSSTNHGAGRRLDNGDKRNLVKAISGFANSEGGVIVWGVDCRNDRQNNPDAGDIPQRATPITNVVRYKSLLEDAVSGATVPSHDGVQHAALAGPDGVDGFVVSLIPKGNHPPYQTVPDLSFKMRAGSNFVSVPRAVLAGMFGRFPQPEITIHFVDSHRSRNGNGGIDFRLAIALQNEGLGIASQVFLNVKVISPGGSEAKVLFTDFDQEQWNTSLIAECIWSSVLKQDGRLPPEGLVLPVSLNISLQEPYDQDFRVICLAGAEGSAPARAILRVPADELRRLFAQEMDAPEEGQTQFGSRVVARLLKVDENQDG